MSSEQQKRTGIARADKGAYGKPEQFIIVGVDIEAAALKARYAGTKRHAYICEIIDGAVQRQRTSKPPSEAFTRGLRRAKQIPHLVVCDLGRDGTKDGWEEDPEKPGKQRKAGKNHVLVIDGRQRNMATRINNTLDIEDGKPPRTLDCDYVTFPANGTRDAVVMLKVGSNVRERRTFSSRAEDAADLARSGIAPDDIAPLVEAADAAEVALLLDLDRCDDAVKASVDEGRTPLKDAARFSKMDPIKQVHAVRRANAAEGNGKAAREARNKAAPPRLKARTPAARAAIVDYLQPSADEDANAKAPVALFSALDLHAFTRWLGGDDDAIRDKGVSDEMRALVAAAKAKP